MGIWVVRGGSECGWGRGGDLYVIVTINTKGRNARVYVCVEAGGDVKGSRDQIHQEIGE